MFIHVERIGLLRKVVGPNGTAGFGSGVLLLAVSWHTSHVRRPKDTTGLTRPRFLHLDLHPPPRLHLNPNPNPHRVSTHPVPRLPLLRFGVVSS